METIIKYPGRPPLPDEDRFVFAIRSYVNLETYEKIQAIAKKKKLKIAAFLRIMVEECLEQNKKYKFE